MTHNCTLVKKFKKIFNYRYPEKIAEVLELLVNMRFYYIELPEILPIGCELFYPKVKNFGQKGDFYFASMGLNFHIIPSIIKENEILHCFTCVHSIDKQEDIIYIESKYIQEECILQLLNYINKKRI